MKIILATEDGGGIYNLGDVDIYDSVVLSNKADSRAIEGIADSSSYTEQGGGIFNAGDLLLSDSSLVGNTSAVLGGGLSNSDIGEGSDTPGGYAELAGVTIWGNTASGSVALGGGGGGIYNSTNSEFVLLNSTIANNISEAAGAGIRSSGTGTISDSLILNNNSNANANLNAGGIAITRQNDNEVNIRNSVVADNTAVNSTTGSRESSDIYSTLGDTTSGGFNFIDDSINFVGADPDTDIRGDDPGISNLTLVDNRATYTVDHDSPTVHSGGTFGAEELEGTLPNIGGYTLSVDTGVAFWSTDEGSGGGSIFRSDAEFNYSQEVITDLSPILDLEVDAAGRRVYWLNQDNDTIWSARFDGTDTREERKVSDNSSEFELDLENGRIFVMAEGDSHSIVQYFDSDVYAVGAEGDYCGKGW